MNVLLIILILMEHVLGALIIADIVKTKLAVLSVTLEWLWNMILMDKDIVRVINVQLVIIPKDGINSLLQPRQLWQVLEPRLLLMRISLPLLRKMVLNILVTVIDV